MSNIVVEVKNNYPLYKELRTKRKTVLKPAIDVNVVKKQFPANRLGNSKTVHETISKEMLFEVEVKISNIHDFKFKLFCTKFSERPYFRFDSAGSTHWNKSDILPLSKQQVQPPHFHEFNEKGIEIAYHTEALKSVKQLEALKDINVCVMHFCEEANARHKQNDYPQINLHAGELGYKFTDEDPLQNIVFR